MHAGCAINFRSMEARCKQHSNSVGTKCFHILLPPFSLISQILRKVRKGRKIDNSYTNMANTTLVSSSLRDVNVMPTAVDTIARSTVRSSGNKHPLVQNRKLVLEAWKVIGNPLRWREF